MGLAISAKLAALLGGTLVMESELKRGTRVHFSFTPKVLSFPSPITLPKEVDQATLGFKSGTIRPKILVVDDCEEIVGFLRTLLEPVGFQLQEAREGGKAVEIARNWHPDLIFMDIQMPGMDGLEATRILRNAPENGRPIIIIISASILEDEKTRAEKAGADGFLLKPFTAKDVFLEIRTKLPKGTFMGDASP